MAKDDTGSVIGADLVVKGELASEGSLSIYGCVEGTISATSVNVESGGKVNGKVSADTVVIMGQVEGSIAAKMVEINKGAQVLADIEHQFLSVQAGASLLGEIKRTGTEPSAHSPAKSLPDFPTRNAGTDRPLSNPAFPLTDQGAASTPGTPASKPEATDG